MSLGVRSRENITIESKRLNAGPTVRSPFRSIALKSLGAAAFFVAVSASSSAFAQNCGSLASAFFPGFDYKGVYGAGISTANAIAATIAATNTAFLTHSTAFVSAPPNPPPDSQGGGVWARVVGGSSTINSSGTTSFNSVVAPPFGAFSENGATTCSSSFKQNFVGAQAGADTARLNVGGWNIHLGTTVGYLETRGNITEGNTPLGGAFDTRTQAPFVGTYAAATYGGFFAEGLLRFNYYETNLNSPTINVYNQKLDAHGISISGSAGYHWAIPNSSWFIEPSAGAIWSRTTIDPLQLAGFTIPGGGNFQGTVQIDDMKSFMGRAGLRVGTVVTSGNVVLQPFAAASVWHEFEGGWSANYNSCTNCIFFLGLAPTNLSAKMDGSGVGTYGVYSLGVAGQIINTGWLGYARFDYENGSDINGWTASGGIRYQFTPEPPHPIIAKAPPMAVVRPVNWTGFYVGAFGGVTSFGHDDVTFDPFPGYGTTWLQLAGALGGGDVGYNYQIGKFVLGLEGDIAWTNTRGSSPCGIFTSPLVPPAFPFFNVTCHDQFDWLATATGRVGYAWDRTLYYVKGGAAWTHENYSIICNLGAVNGAVPQQACTNTAGALFNRISASDDRIGWTAGFGVEFALTDNWSAKGETDYLSFGDNGLTLSDGTGINTKFHFWETKVGVNYRFATR